MKRLILLFGIIILLLAFTNQHAKGQLRYVKGMHQIRVGALTSFQGMGAELGYKYLFTKKMYIKNIYDFELSNRGFTDYQEYKISLQYGYKLFDRWESMFVSAFVGFNLNNVVMHSTVESEKKYQAVFGNGFGLEADYYFYEMLSVSLAIEQKLGYMNGKQHRFQTKISLNYSLY